MKPSPQRTGPDGMTGPRLRVCCTLALLCLVQCDRSASSDATKVAFFDIDGENIDPAARRVIATIATDAVNEARAHLPQLPRPISIRVQPAAHVIPETGEVATAQAPNSVVWMVDVHRPGGARRVAEMWLRASVLHELHHLVRQASLDARTSMLDNAVTEGLATAFERDVGGVVPPWGQYPPEAAAWVEELRGISGNVADRAIWMRRHPDGRRWIAHRAGTYLVDHAIRRSGLTAAQLVTAPTEEVLRLSGSAGPGHRP